MTETDKLNIDSIIARLLEGKNRIYHWIHHHFLLQFKFEIVLKLNYNDQNFYCSSRLSSRKECAAFRKRNQRTMSEI